MTARTNLFAILALSSIALFPHSSVAQSEFLRYRQTGLGVEGSCAMGGETDHGYGASATISIQGVLDFEGSVDWTWSKNGPSSGYDSRGYQTAVAIHPRKSRSSSGIQPRLAGGYTWIKLRGLSYFPGFRPDDSRTAAFGEIGLYLAPEPGRKPAIVPLLGVGRVFAHFGESITYYSAQLALLYPIRSGIVSVRTSVTANRDETLIGFSLGMIASLGRGWGRADEPDDGDDKLNGKGGF